MINSNQGGIPHLEVLLTCDFTYQYAVGCTFIIYTYRDLGQTFSHLLQSFLLSK